jgi:hypothetical protein
MRDGTGNGAVCIFFLMYGACVVSASLSWHFPYYALSFLERDILYTTVTSFSTDSALTFPHDSNFSCKYRKILLLEDF